MAFASTRQLLMGFGGLHAQTRILDVVCNASNNELVRTSAREERVVQIDARALRPFAPPVAHIPSGLALRRHARTAALLHAHPACSLALPHRRPFRQWYEAHYGVSVGKKKKKEGEEKEEAKKSNSVTKKIATRQDGRVLDPNVNAQFDTGRLYACISSRPGQCGRCGGSFWRAGARVLREADGAQEEVSAPFPILLRSFRMRPHQAGAFGWETHALAQRKRPWRRTHSLMFAGHSL